MPGSCMSVMVVNNNFFFTFYGAGFDMSNMVQVELDIQDCSKSKLIMFGD